MRDLTDDENDYDYRPNELAHLAIWHREKYERIVNSNLRESDTIEDWENRNLESARKYLAHYKSQQK